MRTILNIAHRGYTREFPDNTLESCQAAIDLGVDAIEFDVHETADHNFVVFHDDKLQGKYVARLPLCDIQDIKLRECKIPTLEEALDLCRGRAKLLVELKQVQSLERLLAILRAKVVLDDIIIASFNRDLISKFSQLAPEIRRAVITGRPVWNPVKMLKSAQAQVIVVRCPFATSKLVDKVHSSNLSVYVWGCPDIKRTRHVIKLGVDGIISDFPDLVRKELGITLVGESR